MAGGGWQPVEGINAPNVKEIGEFGVAEHNKVALADLKFERVVQYERQVVATDGRAISKNYEAVVWEKLWLDFRKLLSFKRLKRELGSLACAYT